MTVAVKDDLGMVGGARGAGRLHGHSSWKRLWQLPLLLAGVALFGFGVRALIRTIKPVKFELQTAAVRQLLANSQDASSPADAVDEINKVIAHINDLALYYRKPAEQGELQALSGDAIYLAQRQQPALVESNYQAVVDHYEKAVAFGITPGATMNERWGEALLGVGEAKKAIEKLEMAIAQDESLVKVHARELISAYAAGGQMTKALDILERLLKAGDEEARKEDGGGLEAIDNRAWALCKRIEVAILAKHEGGADAGATLEEVIGATREALKTLPERNPSAQVLTWMGRAELEQGGVDQGEKDLNEARARFPAHDLDDGRAALLLAKIAEAKGEWEKAGKLYAEVVERHAGTPVWPAARFGRAEVMVRQTEAKGSADWNFSNQTLDDYHFVISTVTGKEGAESAARAELINKESVQAGLVADYDRAFNGGKLKEALTVLALQAEMGAPEDAASAYRLASTQERRADELMAQAHGVAEMDAAARAALEAEAREMYGDAAEAYQRHAKLATMEDEISGNSLWKAAQLFDKAGKPMKSIAVYQQFTIERPKDPRTPEGLLSIGRLYQSAGMMDQAIAYLERNINENPKTQAAYTSALNLAQCHMALAEAAGASPAPAATGGDAAQNPKVKAEFEKAEAALLSLLGNENLNPSANQFRLSVFMLGDLYYRNEAWADAILRLGEAVERYPDDPGMPRAMFMLAESFRKSARQIAEAVRTDLAITGRDQLENARIDRLSQAAKLFTRVIAILDPEPEDGVAGKQRQLTVLERGYLRTSYMDRAECFFDQGDYAMAIKLYDETATRFSEEVLAVKAYVQIVNAYAALREPTQANAAAERGLGILKRVPDDAFGKGDLSLGRAYYEKLLALGRN